MFIPKEGTIERIVLEKLVEKGEEGVTIFDFPDNPKITEESLEQAVNNLRSNMFESETDNLIKFDS